MRKKRVEERVYDYLKSQIDSGVIGENTKIIEADVAEALSISRSPVRGALKLLADEGYLKLAPYKGAVVESRKMTKTTYVEQLHVFELLLIQYLFQVESKGLELDYLKLGYALADLEKALKSKKGSKAKELQLIFFKELLVAQKNDYYKSLLVTILKALLKADFPELIEMRENSNLFYYHMKQMVKYLQEQKFPQGRREIRILVNSLTLAVIDQQELGATKKYEM
ncbi:GntR family transcriptional regulator [Vagococcus salmoninarum]|uniref:GntR family transcriptional regulator n=1 Tax=Vagococcus salmoninarum TaxID=2739 RepID=UPI003F9758E7